MRQIDLNCDVGEGYPYDELLMGYISSANIACGQHAGDEKSMAETIALAAAHNVAAGAHPSYPDRKNFGRVEMEISPEEVYQLVTLQVGLLSGIAVHCGYPLTHVKPHGALYNRAAKDKLVAKAICRAVYDLDKRLQLFGLSGSMLVEEAKSLGLKTVNEVFADRTYLEDGTLSPRSGPDALIQDPVQSAEQVLQVVQHGTVRTVTGKEIPIQADTICLHGDQEQAPAFARNIRKILEEQGIVISAW